MINLLQQKIVVLMGGSSSEREISLRSGKAVLTALQSEGLNVEAVDLSEDSRLWTEQIKASKVDIAFIALHGTLGEDGCIQGLLETMNIPYTGSSVLASAICMNKRITKSLLQRAGIVTPQTAVIKDGKPQHYPLFIKPVAEGSSVGLHYVADEKEWLALGLEDLSGWLIEECVTGMEATVSVLNGRALPIVEIAPKSGMYDFTSKYTKGATDYYCPARISTEKSARIMDIAERAIAVLGCTGAPRVDFIVPQTGEAVLLEVNTIPGMTETSLLPKAAAEVGLSFSALCIEIIKSVKQGGEL